MKTKKSKLFAFIILAIGLVFLIVGVALLVTAMKRNSETKSSNSPNKNICELSDEAKRAGLGEFMDKVKRTYFELHPNSIGYNPDLKGSLSKSSAIKSRYMAYDPTPSAIKKRTDTAWELLQELKTLDIVQEKLTGRERKAYSKAKLYLQQVFGSPFEVNYYTGDWMLGPDSFCYSRICYMGYELNTAIINHKPDNLEDVKLIKAKLISHKTAINQYIANMQMGVRKGMVRNIEACKAGIDALKFEHQHIALNNETGVFKEYYAKPLLQSNFYSNITKEMEGEWKRTHNNKNVSETIKEWLVEYLGKPTTAMLRYLKEKHLRHCVPSSVSSGLATLPLKYVYVDGIVNTSWPTDPILPLTDKVLNGREAYRQIMPYFTTNDMTPVEVYRLGWKMLNELYPKAVQIAVEVTKISNDNVTAVKEFRKILNSSESFFNKSPIPKNESDEKAHQRCNSIAGAKEHCPSRWRAMQKWFDEARKVMSLLDPKTINMFYFTGPKHTTPNCPVQLVPDFNPSSGAQSYLGSYKACTSPASYYIPFFLDKVGPTFSEWSINAHEARPGHHTQVQGRTEHFQTSCTDSLGWMNKNSYTAFSEGWALYAENPLIAEDTSTYDNEPMQKYGMLQMQIWRALRLIVDPGLHYMNMTRAEALKLHSDRAWDDSDVAQKEVTRYQSVAGQATGYMIGQLDIKKARAYATRELKSKFDLKEFHYQVLSQGALPLGYLSDHIKHYVACAKDPRKTGCDEILVPISKKSANMESLGAESLHLRKKPPHERHYI